MKFLKLIYIHLFDEQHSKLNSVLKSWFIYLKLDNIPIEYIYSKADTSDTKKKRKRQILYDIAYICNIKYDINELIYKRK